MRLKTKKKKKKNIKIKTTKAKKKKENKNKRLSPSWDSNHDRLRRKQGSYPLDYCIIWIVSDLLNICANFCTSYGRPGVKTYYDF